MLFHQLEDAVRVLQRIVALDQALAVFLERPRGLVVGVFLRVIAGEQTVVERELGVHEERGVRVAQYVILKIEIMIEDILDHAPPRNAISVPERSGAYMLERADVPGETGIDVDNLGPLVLCLEHPFERDRVVFSCIAALNENTITVLEIDPVIRHRAASERLCQSRYSGAVSDPGLVIDVHQAVGAGEDGHGPALFAVDVGAAQMGNGLDTVDGRPFAFFLTKPASRSSLRCRAMRSMAKSQSFSSHLSP